ncbi:hypothetical protein [Acinetobacter sp.]
MAGKKSNKKKYDLYKAENRRARNSERKAKAYERKMAKAKARREKREAA